MATSGSVDYTVTRSDIIQAACETVGVVSIGDAIPAEYSANIIRSLNMLVKQYQSQDDYAAGLKIWHRRRATLFLQKDTNQYLIGPTGTHATESYVRSTLTAAVSISGTALTVTSITGISSGDFIGVVMDNNKIHWDTVNGAPSGTTVTLTTGMEAAASSGNYFFTYTTKTRRPLNILTASLRNTSDEDTALGFMDLLEYESIPDKTADGTPTALLYEPVLGNGRLFIDYEPTDVSQVLRYTYLSDAEDFDNATDNPDYPANWFRALKYNLAVEISPDYGMRVSDDLRALAVESLAIAKNSNPQTTNLYFEPNKDE
jgi:hypothetical protein